MKRAGVTGAAGFIGSHLCERCQKGARSSASTTSRTVDGNLSACRGQPRFRFEVVDAPDAGSSAAPSTVRCDRAPAAKKVPRHGGRSTLEVNVNGERSARGAAFLSDADLIVTSTSDVYGNARHHAPKTTPWCSAR